MKVRSKLILLGKRFDGILLPDRGIVRNVVDDRRRKDKVPGVDPPAVPNGLLLEAQYSVTRDLQRSIATRRLRSSDGGEAPVLTVKCDHTCDVDITHTVTIGQAEVLRIEVMTDSL
jgi:hypothetical protein